MAVLKSLKIFDGSNINVAFTDKGIWDQASSRRQHMTVKDDEVASFLVR